MSIHLTLANVNPMPYTKAQSGPQIPSEFLLVVATFSVSRPIRSVWGICVCVFREVPYRWIPWHLFTMATEGQRVVMWILTNQQAAW